MSKFIDLTDREFTRLLVVKRVENNEWGNAQWLCLCDCGNLKVILGVSLRSGFTQSCGCLQKEQVRITGQQSRTHGMSETAIYRIYTDILQRCYNVKCLDYKWYGKRGIRVAKEWLGPDGFKHFYADVGDPPKGKSLDRYPDNNGDYAPDNWRWATATQQANNRRDRIDQRWFKGISVIGRVYTSNNQKRFARIFNLNRQNINACLKGRQQMHKGWIFSYSEAIL